MYTGLHLQSFKHLSASGVIKAMPAPESVVIELDQHADALLRPCVKVGEHVSIGQVIAKPDITYSAWLHSPVSGIVEIINRDHISIRNDRLNQVDAQVPLHAWHQMSPLDLIAHLAAGGIAGLGGAGYSSAAKLVAYAKESIGTLIINGMECEPFITSDDHLMREQASSIIHGIQILMHASGAANSIIAVEDDKPEAIASIRKSIKDCNAEHIEVRVLPTAYPNGDEGRLIKLLLNQEVPRGHLPAKLGLLVHNIATARACAQWVLQGRPLISRVVTVTGRGVVHPQNVETFIGTACRELIYYCGGYTQAVSLLSLGGTMMGRSLATDDSIICKTSNCLIAATPQDISPRYEEQPCIRCAECAVACPVNLLPQQLLMYLRNQNTSAAQQLGLRDCIECGCCDAVCPSHILLASRFRAAKLQAVS